MFHSLMIKHFYPGRTANNTYTSRKPVPMHWYLTPTPKTFSAKTSADPIQFAHLISRMHNQNSLFSSLAMHTYSAKKIPPNPYFVTQETMNVRIKEKDCRFVVRVVVVSVWIHVGS